MNEILILALKEKIKQLQEKINAYQTIIADFESPDIIFKTEENKNPSTIRDRILFAAQQFNGEFSRMELMKNKCGWIWINYSFDFICSRIFQINKSWKAYLYC